MLNLVVQRSLVVGNNVTDCCMDIITGNIMDTSKAAQFMTAFFRENSRVPHVVVE